MNKKLISSCFYGRFPITPAVIRCYFGKGSQKKLIKSTRCRIGELNFPVLTANTAKAYPPPSTRCAPRSLSGTREVAAPPITPAPRTVRCSHPRALPRVSRGSRFAPFTLHSSPYNAGGIFRSYVQNDESLPSARGLLDFKSVQGHGFYVNDQPVPFRVDLFAPPCCFYQVDAIF